MSKRICKMKVNIMIVCLFLPGCGVQNKETREDFMTETEQVKMESEEASLETKEIEMNETDTNESSSVPWYLDLENEEAYPGSYEDVIAQLHAIILADTDEQENINADGLIGVCEYGAIACDDDVDEKLQVFGYQMLDLNEDGNKIKDYCNCLEAGLITC